MRHAIRSMLVCSLLLAASACGGREIATEGGGQFSGAAYRVKRPSGVGYLIVYSEQNAAWESSNDGGATWCREHLAGISFDKLAPRQFLWVTTQTGDACSGSSSAETRYTLERLDYAGSIWSAQVDGTTLTFERFCDAETYSFGTCPH